jgi:hypothetical protein
MNKEAPLLFGVSAPPRRGGAVVGARVGPRPAPQPVLPFAASILRVGAAVVAEQAPRILKVLLLLLAFALGVAEIAFLRARPISETRFARTKGDPPGRINLADPALGVTVRADSSWWAQRHHPAYVLSGRLGTKIEKWVSAPGDRAPWIEVEFDRPRQVEEVGLTLAGALESPDLTMRDYVAECFSADRLIASRTVRDNQDARPRIALPCNGATRVRMTFPIEASGPRDAARVYGLEIQGSP